ncbi:hypothetical protein Syun_014793 [Stephania yunnanensis]|uniref:Uncharacterized protein n=1 Tax=Stephania yunnanensis TaxID=152371 RepID=A0AAP0JK01_9MAGN
MRYWFSSGHVDPRGGPKAIAHSEKALLVIALSTWIHVDPRGHFWGRGRRGHEICPVTKKVSERRGCLYNEETGWSSVERDHERRKEEGTGVRSSGEGGEECTDAAETSADQRTTAEEVAAAEERTRGRGVQSRSGRSAVGEHGGVV